MRMNKPLPILTLIAGVLISGQLIAEEKTAAAPAEAALMGAVGIGVADLEASTEFYQDVLDMEVVRTYELGYINEVVLGFPGGEGAVLVLMNWPGDDARRYDGQDVKLVFYTEDPAGVIERIRARGGKIDREAAPMEVVDGAIVALARDPDGYVIELLERR